MTGSEVVPARLSDHQLVEFMELTRDADSVELKVTVPASQHRPAITRLGIDPLDAEIRQVFFFDTPDLDCHRHGVVVRAPDAAQGRRLCGQAAPGSARRRAQGDQKVTHVEGRGQGCRPTGEQEPKTLRALEFFSERIAATEAVSAAR